MSYSEATDKNHEQYLEEIETAVAETTKELMASENWNLREAYRKIAQQDVEIKRLKEYQTNDRKTIRNLRAQLAEASEENEELKKRLNNFTKATISQVNSHVEQILELKEENKKLKKV